MTVDELILMARQLSPLEKLKLIEQLAPDLEPASAPGNAVSRRRGLRGSLKGSLISGEDIEQIRRTAINVGPCTS
jgi:hypothetical protein